MKSHDIYKKPILVDRDRRNRWYMNGMCIRKSSIQMSSYINDIHMMNESNCVRDFGINGVSLRSKVICKVDVSNLIKLRTGRGGSSINKSNKPQYMTPTLPHNNINRNDPSNPKPKWVTTWIRICEGITISGVLRVLRRQGLPTFYDNINFFEDDEMIINVPKPKSNTPFKSFSPPTIYIKINEKIKHPENPYKVFSEPADRPHSRRAAKKVQDPQPAPSNSVRAPQPERKDVTAPQPDRRSGDGPTAYPLTPDTIGVTANIVSKIKIQPNLKTKNKFQIKNTPLKVYKKSEAPKKKNNPLKTHIKSLFEKINKPKRSKRKIKWNKNKEKHNLRKDPVYPKANNSIKIATMNPNTWGDTVGPNPERAQKEGKSFNIPGRLRNILDKAEIEGFSILGFQESRFPEGFFRAGNYNIFTSQCKKNKTNASTQGCAIALHKNIDIETCTADPIDSRLIAVHINSKPLPMTILSAYGPQENANVEEKDKYWNKLDEYLSALDKKDIKILLTDNNGQVKREEDNNDIIGPFAATLPRASVKDSLYTFSFIFDLSSLFLASTLDFWVYLYFMVIPTAWW